ncbi:MAG TPA: nitrate- and nitrite sensing domain-containing protein [Actinophytocola sp.]|uniref:sensor histidine kinase n=1 Tax=Actinophytocola sp. TaxID=1872138 RepID=UPI002F936AC9
MSGRHVLARYTGAARGVLNRLRIRGKLNLLVALPLAAILLVAVPFVIVQIDNARSAAGTARLSGQTRELGALISELQRERLVMSAYLSNVTERESVTRQTKIVDDLAKRVRADLGADASEEVTQALEGLASLNSLRQSVLDKAATQESLARTYRATDDALIDALRLVPQRNSDAEGTRQLTALEALLRANEQSTLAGMALLIAAADKETGLPILDDAQAEAQISTERFVQQADIDEAGLVVAVEQGDEARAVKTLVERATDTRSPSEADSFAASAYNSVGAQSKLREVAQDQVTSQITDAAQARADGAATLAWLVGGGVLLLIGLVLALAVVVSRSIASPMRRLTAAATDVANLADTELVRVADTEVASEQVPRLAAIEVTTRDEVGELAHAFNRVQATAAMLVERQAVTRRNVSLMFANVAQRTQNLVGRQLNLVDELERNEQDTRLLESLYRLDHLSTRLRRSADSLLVVAGTRNEDKLSGPVELSTALRSALAEIEDYQRVHLGEVCDITLDSDIGPDLVLVFAELLENATSYSPPDTSVEIDTRYLVNGSCVVTVIDHGIGMSQERLAEENHRLVARERLDITPTSMLGLFVVGRLARRHNLTVAMVATEGGGVTVDVVVPENRFRRNDEPETAPHHIPGYAQTGNGQVNWQMVFQGIAIPPAFSENFSWFPPEATETPAEHSGQFAPINLSTEPMMSSSESSAAPNGQTPPKSSETTVAERGGLRRRVAGAQLPGSAAAPPPTRAAPNRPAVRPASAKRDAASDRGAFDGYQSAFARASEYAVSPAEETSPDGTRSGLLRRVPGESMAPGLRVGKPGKPPSRVTSEWRERDPEADRMKLDDFTSGLSRAGTAPHQREVDG